MTSKNNKHKTIDAHSYVESLKKPWKTMQQDVDAALAIIEFETEKSVSQIKLIDKVEHQDNAMVFSFPDWHEPVEQYFVEQYGKEQGSFIFEKVVIQLYRRARGTVEYVH